MKMTFINKKTYSIHEVENIVLAYEEIRKLARIFQLNGELSDKLEWGDNIVIDGFKFLLDEYKKKMSLKEDMSSKEDKNNT